MQVNSITEAEVEDEIRRRRGDGGAAVSASLPKKPLPSGDALGWAPLSKEISANSEADCSDLTPATISQQLLVVRELVLNLNKSGVENNSDLQTQLSKVLNELDSLASTIYTEEQLISRANSEVQLQQDLERENYRIRQEVKPADGTSSQHF